jgi:putative flippase GtrA
LFEPSADTARWAGLPSWLRLLMRFGLAGLANTAFGFSIIAALELGLGTQRNVANAVGYGAAMILSYGLNRNFVFRDSGAAGASIVRFLAAQALSFAVNQAVLVVVAGFLGESAVERMAAQLVAMTSYTVTFFVLCKVWVFRARPNPGR